MECGQSRVEIAFNANATQSASIYENRHGRPSVRILDMGVCEARLASHLLSL